mgnify:FL=1|jgi:hypothetical protein
MFMMLGASPRLSIQHGVAEWLNVPLVLAAGASREHCDFRREGAHYSSCAYVI